MVDISILPAEEAHCEALAQGMRAADILEVRAASGLDPLEGLRLSLLSSDAAWTGFVDGEVAAMWGLSLVSFLTGKWAPWMLGTDVITQHPLAVLRQSRLIVEGMKGRARVLENHVDARNEISIRWLKWLGFSFDEAQPFGFERRLFHRFYMNCEVRKCA